jgi:hypothetical protein
MQLCFLNCCNKQCLTVVCAALCVCVCVCVCVCYVTLQCWVGRGIAVFCDVEEQNGMSQNKINEFLFLNEFHPIL